MVILGAWIAVGVFSVAGVESPKYTVLETCDGYEVREYPDHVVAEVRVQDAFDPALNKGFRKLADFIFGNNTAAKSASNAEGSEARKVGESSARIAMTAPVLETESRSAKIPMTAPVLEQTPAAAADQTSAERVHTVAFVMPNSYTVETLPKPNNPEVTLRAVPKVRYAALRFSGFVPEEKAEKMKARLKELLARDGRVTLGEPVLAQYNPPWTPPFLRRNEVWLQVE